MNVLITGGTGFIGSRLALDSLQKGHRVTIVGQENNAIESQNRRSIEKKGGSVVTCSVTDREKIFDIVRGADVVYHLAAAQHEANVPDKTFRDVNVDGTRNVLEASLNARIKRFVHGSTIGVYGTALEGRLDELSPVKPDNIYGVTKLEAESLVRSFQEKLPLVVIRISETYGPGDHRLLKLFKAINKNAFLLIGSGQNIHHLIYIGDLIEGLHLAAIKEEAVGKIFVFSGKDALTTSKMVQVIAAELGKKIPRLALPLPPFLALATLTETICRPLGIQPPLHRRRMDFFRKSFQFSQKQAREFMGFTPRVTFEEGVAETAKWYRTTGYL
jgi:nucleoside-diphosphate-sugar epimerase